MHAKMSNEVSNKTSSQEPEAISCRIFVGNLNTMEVTKAELERTFQRYGCLAGISMHKGYAFIQFTTPLDARSACQGEDGRLISGKTIDVNMVSEPKPLHGQAQNINRKRRLHQEDCHDRSSELQAARRRLLQGLPLMEQNDKPDLLICGNCRELFFRLADIVDHKRHYCKLRLECKCNNSTPNHNNSNNLVEQNQPRQNDCQDRGQTLICSTCNNIFTDHWRLMFHAQMVHSLPIYELRSDRGHSKQSESPGGN